MPSWFQKLFSKKLVHFAMSYMSADSAARWAERQERKEPFPYPTWNAFVTDFKLRFVQENEQDHALQKLEGRDYYMGSRDVFKYTDDFEDLYDIASFEDDLVKVTKYRSGLDPVINQAITASSDAPGLRDYLSWRSRAYRQYEANLRARTSGRPPAPVATPAQLRSRSVFPAPLARTPGVPGVHSRNSGVSSHSTAASTQAPPRTPVPTPAAPVPMDVDRTRARPTPRSCFRCGDPSHIARDCPHPADVQSADLLDEVVHQLGGDLLGELLARVATTQELPAGGPEPEVSPPEGFYPCDE